jgi:hypothetical protein
MTTTCYVTIHTQALIEQCEAARQFAAFDNVTYLLVGQRPYDSNRSDVIVPRTLSPNREHLPQFYDFTGWWALCRHYLIDADRVVMQQYDMHTVDPQIQTKCEALLDTPGVVAMTVGYKRPSWTPRLAGFASTFERGIATRGLTMADVEPVNKWPSTQGTAWRTEDLVAFMEWFEPMWDVFAGHTFAGHLAERSVQAWHVACGYQPKYLRGVMSHAAADCHGTGALMAGQRQIYETRNAEFMYQSS